MTKPQRPLCRALLVSPLLLAALVVSPLMAAETSAVEEGKKLAYDRKKGNCLACHAMGDGEAPGNIGPPLLIMKQRFPDKAKLRAQIYDATQVNPESRMPPFGRHQILTDEEVDKITEYVYTL